MHHYSSLKMPPNHHFIMSTVPIEPVSRTYQYRKIMKPMLERKRRARINKCLDELKDLMTGTLQADGENVSKLEKADILELTVRHLHRLRETNSLFIQPTPGGESSESSNASMEKFWAGFQQCATEVFQYLHKYDRQITGNLLQHIAGYIPAIRAAAVPTANASTALKPLTAAQNSALDPLDYQRFFAAVKTENCAQDEMKTPLRSNQRVHPYQRAIELERNRNKDCEGGVWRPW